MTFDFLAGFAVGVLSVLGTLGLIAAFAAIGLRAVLRQWLIAGE